MIRGSKLPGMNKKDKEIEIIKQAGITYKPRSRLWMPAKCEFPVFTGGPGRTRTFGQLIKSQFFRHFRDFHLISFYQTILLTLL